MNNKIRIYKMNESDIGQAADIWQGCYNKYSSGNESFPSYWKTNSSEIKDFLKQKVKDETAFAAETDRILIGYLAFDEFNFNGEESVFCPSIGHAVIDDYADKVYPLLYQAAAEDWVSRNIFNHMWTINYNDTRLKNTLYDLGFGSYLIDAFARSDAKLDAASDYEIRKASANDADILYSLVEESREYYASSPLFLKRDPYSIDDISKIINNGNVLIAFDNNIPVGFINLSVSNENNCIDLSVINHGMIDEIGAYIKPEHRGNNLGKDLLKNVFNHCASNNIELIHVDFETANLFANKFWTKYFKPVLLSVRRTINKNIND
ncbi:MAG: GNAT family N-acetyltransferase [Spirochaetes bacterium]|nr:GNAT family N-acetyltransferase [Spirochaetota bacterium]